MKIGSIVVKCKDFEKMLAFWQEALHHVPRVPVKDGFIILKDPEGIGPNISLDKTIEHERVGSTQNPRLHLDLTLPTEKPKFIDSFELEQLATHKHMTLRMTSSF